MKLKVLNLVRHCGIIEWDACLNFQLILKCLTKQGSSRAGQAFLPSLSRCSERSRCRLSAIKITSLIPNSKNCRNLHLCSRSRAPRTSLRPARAAASEITLKWTLRISCSKIADSRTRTPKIPHLKPKPSSSSPSSCQAHPTQILCLRFKTRQWLMTNSFLSRRRRHTGTMKTRRTRSSSPASTSSASKAT